MARKWSTLSGQQGRNGAATKRLQLLSFHIRTTGEKYAHDADKQLRKYILIIQENKIKPILEYKTVYFLVFVQKKVML
jgi:hypothetical protein